MDNNTFSTPETGKSKLVLIVCIILGVFVLIFAGLYVSSYLKERAATTDLNAKKTTAYNAGKEAGAKSQKIADEAAARTAAENPYRAYTAPTPYGNFTIKFPKNWSSSVAESLNATNQVDLIANPNFIKVVTDNSANYALRVTLVDTPYESLKDSYDQQVKNKKAKATTATVSGITGTRYTGAYRQAKDGVAVLVPVRDKTMVFITDNTNYLSEFETALSQSTIKP